MRPACSAFPRPPSAPPTQPKQQAQLQPSLAAPGAGRQQVHRCASRPDALAGQCCAMLGLARPRPQRPPPTRCPPTGFAVKTEDGQRWVLTNAHSVTYNTQARMRGMGGWGPARPAGLAVLLVRALAGAACCSCPQAFSATKGAPSAPSTKLFSRSSVHLRRFSSSGAATTKSIAPESWYVWLSLHCRAPAACGSPAWQLYLICIAPSPPARRPLARSATSRCSRVGGWARMQCRLPAQPSTRPLLSCAD